MNMPLKKTLTTGDIAAYCSVSRVGVLRWIKEGRLKAHRTPGGHFRIYPHDLDIFLSKTEFSAPAVPQMQQATRLLLITQNTDILASVIRLLSVMSVSLEIDIAMNNAATTKKLANFQPMIVVFDGSSPVLNTASFAEQIKGIGHNSQQKPALLLANLTTTPKEVAHLEKFFSPIVIESTLPSRTTGQKAARFQFIIQQLLNE